MKRLLFYFLILFGVIWLGGYIHNNPGYVLVSAKNWSMETSLWFAIIALVILFILALTLIRFTGGITKFYQTTKHWFKNRKERHARQKTILGLYELAEGDWKRAEKHLIKAVKYSDMPLINYLAAALLAQRQSAFERRDNYLRHAQKKFQAHHPFAIALTQARLQIENAQWEEAAATLYQLHQQKPKNSYILQELRYTYEKLNDWKALKKLLPKLRKLRVNSTTELNLLERKIWMELLQEAITNNTIETMWNKLPKYLHKEADLLAIYAQYLIAHNQNEEAEDLIKLSLRKKLDKKLLGLYSQLKSPKPLKLLARAESWLNSNPENPDLLFCLGIICKDQMLWGKSRHYFERCLKILPSPAVYFELAEIMKQQNDVQGALEYYKAGAALIV